MPGGAHPHLDPRRALSYRLAMCTPPDDTGERALIAALARRFGAGSRASTRVGPGDDAAVLSGDGELVVSSDSFVEEVHFRREWGPWASVGYKAAVTTVSDLAAMAVRSEWLLVALGVEARDEDVMRIVDGVGTGIAEAAQEYGFDVVGGDVSASGTTFLALTTGGWASAPPILRSGAREGDLLVITGSVGRSAAALRVLAEDAATDDAAEIAAADAAEVVAHFLRPSAGFADAEALRALGARALIDVSDGLASEAGHLAAASGVGVVIDAAHVPVHAAARRVFAALGVEPLQAALASGEEYVLLAAVPGDTSGELERVRRARGWTVAGRFGGAAGVWLDRAGGAREKITGAARGWRHFG